MHVFYFVLSMLSLLLALILFLGAALYLLPMVPAIVGALSLLVLGFALSWLADKHTATAYHDFLI